MKEYNVPEFTQTKIIKKKMASPRETDKRVRKLASQDPRAGQEMHQFQQGQNELMDINNQRQNLLREQMVQQQAEAGQNQILAQAGEMGIQAAMGDGSQALAAQMSRMQPQTQATLAKYGVKQGAPKVQRQSGRSVQVQPNKVTVNNTTYTTIHNDTKITQPAAPAAPVVVPSAAKGGGAAGTIAKFKTWMSNVFARQREENVIRQKEYQRKEWSLSRSASRMMRGLEKLGKTFAERLDPRKLAGGKMSSMKMLSYMMTIQMVRKWWPEIIKAIGWVGDKVSKVVEFFGWKDGSWDWEHSKLRSTILSLLGSDVKDNETIPQALYRLFWNDSDTGKKGILNYFLEKLKGFFNWDERLKAVQSIEFPDLGSIGGEWGGLFSGITGALKGIAEYLKDVFTALFTGKSFSSLRAGREVQRESIGNKTISNAEITKSGRPSISQNENAHSYNQGAEGYLTTEDGSLITQKSQWGHGDYAVYGYTGDKRQDWLMPSDRTSDGEITNGQGASMRLSSTMVNEIGDSSKVDSVFASMKALKDQAGKQETGVHVIPEMLDKLQDTFGIDVSKYKKNTEKVKFIPVPRSEEDTFHSTYDTGKDFLKNAAQFAANRGKFWWLDLLTLGVAPTAEAIARTVSSAGKYIDNKLLEKIKNGDLSDFVLKAIPYDSPLPGIVDKNKREVTREIPTLSKDDIEQIEKDIASVVGLSEGESDDFEASNVAFSSSWQDWLRNNGKDTKYNEAMKVERESAGLGSMPLVISPDAEYARFVEGWDEASIKLKLQSDPRVTKAYYSGAKADISTGRLVNKNGKNVSEYIDTLYDQFTSQLSKDGKNTTLKLGDGTELDLSYMVDSRSLNQVDEDAKNKYKEEASKNSSSAVSQLEKEREEYKKKENKKEEGSTESETRAGAAGDYIANLGKSAVDSVVGATTKLWDNVSGVKSVKGAASNEDLQKKEIKIPENWSAEQKQHASNAWAMAKYFHQQNPKVDPRIVYGQMVLETGEFTNEGSKGYNYGGYKVPGNSKTVNGHSLWDDPEQAKRDIYNTFYAPGKRQATGYAAMGSNVDVIGDTLGTRGTYYFSGNPKDYQKNVISKMEQAGFMDSDGKLSQVIAEDSEAKKKVEEYGAATREYIKNQESSSENSSTSVAPTGGDIVDWYNKNVKGKINKYSHGAEFKITGDNTIQSSCSTSTRQAFKEIAGIDIGGNTAQQIKNGDWVENSGNIDIKGSIISSDIVPDESKLQPGDLLFYRLPGELDSEHASRDYGVGHVEVYMGNGMKLGTGGDGERKLTPLTTLPTTSKGTEIYIGSKRYIQSGASTGKVTGSSQSGGGIFGNIFGDDSIFGKLWGGVKNIFSKIKEGFNSLLDLNDPDKGWEEVSNPKEFLISEFGSQKGDSFLRELINNKSTNRNVADALSAEDPNYEYRVEYDSQKKGVFKLFKKEKKTGNASNEETSLSDLKTTENKTQESNKRSIKKESSTPKRLPEQGVGDGWEKISKDVLEEEKAKAVKSFGENEVFYQEYKESAFDPWRLPTFLTKWDPLYEYKTEPSTEGEGYTFYRKKKTFNESVEDLKLNNEEKSREEINDSSINTNAEIINPEKIDSDQFNPWFNFKDKALKKRASDIFGKKDKTFKDLLKDKTYPELVEILNRQDTEFEYKLEPKTDESGRTTYSYYRRKRSLPREKTVQTLDIDQETLPEAYSPTFDIDLEKKKEEIDVDTKEWNRISNVEEQSRIFQNLPGYQDWRKSFAETPKLEDMVSFANESDPYHEYKLDRSKDGNLDLLIKKRGEENFITLPEIEVTANKLKKSAPGIDAEIENPGKLQESNITKPDNWEVISDSTVQKTVNVLANSEDIGDSFSRELADSHGHNLAGILSKYDPKYDYQQDKVLGSDGEPVTVMKRKEKDSKEAKQTISGFSEFKDILMDSLGEMMGIRFPDKIQDTSDGKFGMETPGGSSDVAEKIIGGEDIKAKERDINKAGFTTLHSDLSSLRSITAKIGELIVHKPSGNNIYTTNVTNTTQSSDSYTKNKR